MAVSVVALAGLALLVWWPRDAEKALGPRTIEVGDPAARSTSQSHEPRVGAASATAEPQAEAGALKREAVTVASQVAEAYPDDALSYALLGSAYYNTGQSEEATRQLKRCLELNPKQVDAYEILARVAYEKGELEESNRLCREALKLDPANVEVLSQLGRALMDLGQTEEAIGALERAAGSPRSTSESHYLLGQARLQSGKYEEAKQSFQQATRLVPDHTQAFFGLYTACMRLGQSEESDRYREQFLRLEAIDRQSLTDRSAREDTLTGLPLVRKTVARTFFGAAQIYRLHGEASRATDLFQRAALLDPDAPAYRAALESWYVQRNLLSDGVKAFDELVAAQPGNGLNHYFRGRLHDRLGQFDPAEREYRRVQQLAPGWAEGYRALAELYVRADRKPAEAMVAARRAVELEPVDAHYYVLAVACSRNRDRAGALEAIEQAIALSPNEARYREFRRQLEQSP